MYGAQFTLITFILLLYLPRILYLKCYTCIGRNLRLPVTISHTCVYTTIVSTRFICVNSAAQCSYTTRRDTVRTGLAKRNSLLHNRLHDSVTATRIVVLAVCFVHAFNQQKKQKKRYTRLRVLIFPPSSIVTLPKRLDGRRCQRDHARGRRLLGTRLDRLCRSVGSQRTLGINRVFLKPYGQSILKQCPGIVVCGVAAIRHRRCEIKNKYIRVLCY